MYVCVCRAVTDHDIQVAIDEGHADLPSLQHRTGVATGCGCCREYTEALLAEASTTHVETYDAA
jgi:bacterioferritin-associated ferredoxin